MLFLILFIGAIIISVIIQIIYRENPKLIIETAKRWAVIYGFLIGGLFILTLGIPLIFNRLGHSQCLSIWPLIMGTIIWFVVPWLMVHMVHKVNGVIVKFVVKAKKN